MVNGPGQLQAGDRQGGRPSAVTAGRRSVKAVPKGLSMTTFQPSGPRRAVRTGQATAAGTLRGLDSRRIARAAPGAARNCDVGATRRTGTAWLGQTAWP